MSDFASAWTSQYQGTPAIGYRLRNDYADRWVRFHSLPSSKGHPDTDAEMSIILARANALAASIFAQDTPIWIVTNRILGVKDVAGSQDYDARRFLFEQLEIPVSHIWISSWEESDDQLKHACYAKRLKWKPRTLDKLFSKIASDEEWGFALVSKGMQSVLTPYAGGFDVILPTPRHVEYLSEINHDWLPYREDGL